MLQPNQSTEAHHGQPESGQSQIQRATVSIASKLPHVVVAAVAAPAPRHSDSRGHSLSQATGRSASAAISRVICTASVGIHGSIALALCTSHIWSPRAGAEITMACPKGGATDSDSLCTADRAGHPAEPKTPPQNQITYGVANGVHSTELIEHGDALPVGRSPMLGTAVVGQYKLEISWRPATTARPPLIRHPELHCRTLLFLQRQEHR